MDSPAYGKSSGSVAVLGYYCVMPYAIGKALPKEILKSLPPDETLESIRAAIDWCIKGACLTMQAKLVKGDRVFDDGLLEVVPVHYATHVDLYLRLPATISVHSALKHIRTAGASLMPKTILSLFEQRYKYLFSPKYLAFSCAYDFDHVNETDRSVYHHYLDVFRLENNLEISEKSLYKQKYEQLVTLEQFMSEDISIYE